MSFSDLITNHGSRIDKEHYIHLVQVSAVDGKISPSELQILHKEGRKFGLTETEIEKLVKSEIKNHYNPPYSLSEKFEHLYNIASMILADDVITESEKRIIKRFSIEAGFKDETIDSLLDLLFEGIRKGEDEENLFNKFKKTHFQKS
jgi:hypothetical protein